MIEKLTPEEEALIPIVRDEWIKIGLATGPADREAAQAAIADAYTQAGLAPPKHWIWLGSPWAGCIGALMLTQLPIPTNSVRDQVEAQVGDWVADQGCDQVWAQVRAQVGAQLGDQVGAQVWDHVEAQVRAQVRDQVGDHVGAQVRDQVWAQVWQEVWDQVWDLVEDQVLNQVWDQVGYHVWNHEVGGLVWGQVRAQVQEQVGYGQHDARWLAFYDMFRRIKRVQGPERLEPLMRLAAVAGWWWPFAGACIITERPTILHRDEAGRLHCDSGPALVYPDGWAIHAWNGLRIPARLIEDKARITPDTIEADDNAELRRVMLEIFGFDKYIEARGARLIAEDACLGLPRQLFEIDLGGEPVRVLRVVNGTVELGGRP